MFRHRFLIQAFLLILMPLGVQNAFSWCSRDYFLKRDNFIEQTEWCKDTVSHAILKYDRSQQSSFQVLDSLPFDSVGYVRIQLDHRSIGDLMVTMGWFGAGIFISTSAYVLGGWDNPLIGLGLPLITVPFFRCDYSDFAMTEVSRTALEIEWSDVSFKNCIHVQNEILKPEIDAGVEAGPPMSTWMKVAIVGGSSLALGALGYGLGESKSCDGSVPCYSPVVPFLLGGMGFAGSLFFVWNL